MTHRDEYYVWNPIRPKLAKVTKFVDDEPKIDSVYEVGPHSCQCFQAQRGQCRHMKMFPVWHEKGEVRSKMTFWEKKGFAPQITCEPLSEEGLL